MNFNFFAIIKIYNSWIIKIYNTWIFKFAKLEHIVLYPSCYLKCALSKSSEVEIIFGLMILLTKFWKMRVFISLNFCEIDKIDITRLNSLNYNFIDRPFCVSWVHKIRLNLNVNCNHALANLFLNQDKLKQIKTNLKNSRFIIWKRLNWS